MPLYPGGTTLVLMRSDQLGAALQPKLAYMHRRWVSPEGQILARRVSVRVLPCSSLFCVRLVHQRARTWPAYRAAHSRSEHASNNRELAVDAHRRMRLF